MPKRVLHSIRLDKIAAVDLPCQEHATVAIIKRAPFAPAPTGARSIAKATFEEALQANMTADAVNDAFSSSFDGLWERNEAFRIALTDELAEGGSGESASEAYVSSIKALVDEAVAAARGAGATASDTSQIEKVLTATVGTWLKSKEQEQIMKIETRAELKAAIKAFDPTKATVADRDVILKAATDLGAESELPVSGPLAKTAPTDQTAALVREIALLKMAPAVRKHFDGLKGDGQTAFLAKSQADQTAEVEALNAEDPVELTLEDGTEVRKSAGPTVIAMAKRIMKQEGVIKTLTESSETDAIEKALVRYPNVAKGIATTMLKSAHRAPQAERLEIESALAAMNKASGPLFKRVGSSGSLESEQAPDSVLGKMDAIVKRIATDRNITIAKATIEAANDSEYRALYAEDAAEKPHVQAHA